MNRRISTQGHGVREIGVQDCDRKYPNLDINGQDALVVLVDLGVYRVFSAENSFNEAPDRALGFGYTPLIPYYRI